MIETVAQQAEVLLMSAGLWPCGRLRLGDLAAWWLAAAMINGSVYSSTSCEVLGTRLSEAAAVKGMQRAHGPSATSLARLSSGSCRTAGVAQVLMVRQWLPAVGGLCLIYAA